MRNILNFAAAWVIYEIMSAEGVDVRSRATARCSFTVSPSFRQLRSTSLQRKENVDDMSKTLDVITEIIRNPKQSFRKADDRPVKAQKHRYERRKIREFIRLGDWVHETPA
jgi:hypothetical protein